MLRAGRRANDLGIAPCFVANTPVHVVERPPLLVTAGGASTDEQATLLSRKEWAGLLLVSGGAVLTAAAWRRKNRKRQDPQSEAAELDIVAAAFADYESDRGLFEPEPDERKLVAV